jgi:LDH2 family malate/lactate/ureidoglycolate dehydrogenase
VDEVATCVAEHVVDAELAGHPSHGLRQIPLYCTRSGQPGFDLSATPAVLARRGALTSIDGCSGLGHPALRLAVDCAASSARELGVAAASVVRCGHAGRAGAWAERGTAAGAITIVALAGVAPPFIVSAGAGCKPALHTNPIAIGVPGAESPLLLDFATSAVAEGKVALARNRDEPLAAGTILDADGRPSVDPGDFYAGGSLLPFGGHKGFGLSVLVEALAVSWTGADAPGSEPAEGALVLCVDAAGMRGEEELIASVEALRARLHRSGPVLAPGEPEARSRAAAEGIAVDERLLATLRALADASGEGRA